MSDWVKTSTQHMIKHVPSGTYYLRKCIKGKIHRLSLKTDMPSVAKARLPVEIQKLVSQQEYRSSSYSAAKDLSQCFDIAKQKSTSKSNLRENSATYRENTFIFLEKTFKGLKGLKPKELTADLCNEWFSSIKPPVYSAPLCNNALGSLRMIIKEAINCGLISVDPTREIQKHRVTKKNLELPSPEKFKEFVAAIRKPLNERKHSWRSDAAADFVEFCAYSGVRKEGANNLKWKDINLHNKTIHVTEKGGYSRYIPIIPAMEELLARLPRKEGRDNVLRVKEAEISMTKAAERVKMQRITHHDLRHLFATTCIESGVDIPTVANWLGHKDGGVLALKTYGHLRESHSIKAAQKVAF